MEKVLTFQRIWNIIINVNSKKYGICKSLQLEAVKTSDKA